MRTSCQIVDQSCALSSPATHQFPPARGRSILDLRKLLAERFPQASCPPNARLATGIPPLDELTGGGLPRGAITEITASQRSAGSALLICALLQAACEDRSFLALIDGRDSFDPQPLGDERLRHLLWVRCRTAMDAVKSADLLLRDGNFQLIILDLVLNRAEELQKIPQSSWYRLQRLVEPVPAAFLVLTHRGMIASAQVKLVLENRWTLGDLARDYSAARWSMRVQRMHSGRQQMAEVG
ncbi:MAG: hypothetical protein M3Z64_09105 [Verrucomicrobiota bacterium]|nr:hypothetical protein [Verrucomicrobiota bacterium]